MMRGSCTDRRYGILSARRVRYLIRPDVVKRNLEDERPTYRYGGMVEVMDNAREKVIKPIYRAMPVAVKTFYDKVRYKI